MQSLSRQLAAAQETERRNLARELHDQVGQALTALKLILNSAAIQAGESNISQLLDKSIQAADQAIEQVRTLSTDLRPSVLDDLGLAAALRWYFHKQASLAEIQVNLTAAAEVLRAPSPIETACFRVAQEACTNILRHAQAKNIWADLTQEKGEMGLIIRDDGIGFDVAQAQLAAQAGRSLGLLSMAERAEFQGGSLTIESKPGEGTRLVIRLPINADLDEEKKP